MDACFTTYSVVKLITNNKVQNGGLMTEKLEDGLVIFFLIFFSQN